MNVYELMFIIQFLAFLLILALKLYNIFTLGKFLNLKLSFILLLGFLICFALSFVVMLSHPEITMYLSLFKFQTWLLILGIVFFFIELALFVASEAKRPIEAYNSLKNRSANMSLKLR